jgi:hypothetical protein
LLDRIVVIDHDGNVFGHVVEGPGNFPKTIGPAFKFDGSKVAFNAPFERFVVTMQDVSIRRIVVIGHDGNVFGHDVTGNTIGPAFKFDGSKVAFNAPAERFVVTVQAARIVVIDHDGNVFGHAVTGKTIGPAFKFDGSKVAFNAPSERFVLQFGTDLILVITNRGDVFGHAMQFSP